MQGSAIGATGGLGLLADNAMDLKSQVEEAHAQIQLGTVFGLLLGLLIAAGALYALYARWDDAGRPLPGFLARRFPRLAGAP